MTGACKARWVRGSGSRAGRGCPRGRAMASTKRAAARTGPVGPPPPARAPPAPARHERPCRNGTSTLVDGEREPEALALGHESLRLDPAVVLHGTAQRARLGDQAGREVGGGEERHALEAALVEERAAHAQRMPPVAAIGLDAEGRRRRSAAVE